MYYIYSSLFELCIPVYIYEDLSDAFWNICIYNNESSTLDMTNVFIVAQATSNFSPFSYFNAG